MKTCMTYGNSTWHASKCKVHKLHKRFTLQFSKHLLISQIDAKEMTLIVKKKKKGMYTVVYKNIGHFHD